MRHPIFARRDWLDALAVIAFFAFLFWITGAQVSDEEIRAAPTVQR